MQVAVKDHQDIYRPYLPCEDHVGKSTFKADQQVTCLEGKGSLFCTENVAQTIENLLPDEEDLFSGLINDLGHTAITNGDDRDDEDFDLFSSSGGLELEGSSKLNMQQRNYVTNEGLLSDQSSSDYSVACQHPSRMLIVKNVDTIIEDSELRVLFEQYGDIRSFYTACRCRGFVIISYYDIRAARSALNTLQNKSLRNVKLQIHYSNPKDDPSGQYADQGSLEIYDCDSSISSNKLHEIFSSFGEIEEICGTTPHHKHIKYYDIRAAEAALNGLNSSNMLQKEQIKLEVSYPVRSRSSIQQFTHGLVRGQLRSCQSLNGNSLPQAFLTANISPGVVVNSCMKDGYIHGVDSVSDMSINAVAKDDLIRDTCYSTNSLPLPVGSAFISNQFGLHGPHYSLDQARSCNHITSFHPQSFPKNCEGFVGDGDHTYDSLSSIEGLTSVDSRTTPTNDKHLHTLGSYSSHEEHLFRGYSSSSLPLIGHHVWNHSNLFQHHDLNNMHWSHSPPLINGVSGHGTSNLPVLLEVPPPVLFTHKQHIIRSAPSGSISCEDLQHAYLGESSIADHHLTPLRVVGFPITMSHPSKIASRDFSQVNGYCMDSSPNSTIWSPQIINHKYPSRNVETTSPIYLGRPRGRARRLSHLRHETVSCHIDEKKYDLDIERVLRGEDIRTTLMIKNIPNKYSSQTLLAAIDEHNQGTYDFIYLPLDFKNKCNMGYAFINMTDPLQIVQFHKSFNGKKWEKFHSGKVACLAYARIQGKDALIAHFQESSLMNEDKCCHPILFTTDGPNAGNQEPFPLGTSIHSRRHRTRCNTNEVNQNQESSSSSL